MDSDRGGFEFPGIISYIRVKKNWSDELKKRTFILFFLLSQINTPCFGQSEAPFHIFAKQINSNETIWLDTNWKFLPGDNPEFASPNFDDSDWEYVETNLKKDSFPANKWPGIGWFRLHVTIDSSLISQLLGLKIIQAGASETYIDGELICRFGKIGQTKRDEVRRFSRIPNNFSFKDSTNHVIALRYSNHIAERFQKLGASAGFSVSLNDYEPAISQSIARIKKYTTNKLIFFSIPLIIAVFHFLLFIYYPKLKDNLFYSIMLLGFSVLVYAQFEPYLSINYFHILLYNRLFFVAMLVATLFGLFTTYSNLPRFPKYAPILIFVNVALMIIVFLKPGQKVVLTVLAFMLLELIEISRKLMKMSNQDRFNIWASRIGFLILFVSVTYQILMGFYIVPTLFGVIYPYFIGILAMMFSMSMNMARDFAITAKNLENQLIQVKELSEKTLAQERLAREQEFEKRLLEADNKRKTKELEDARQFQLSMLPRFNNDIPGLDICFDMKPATEVGGDYYDYFLAEDGSLTIAVGDATGHGMKAGTMVLTMKNLFISYAPKMEAPEFLATCSDMIKKLKLGNIYMAMSLMKISGNKLSITSAGMPPVLIYRSLENVVEEIVLKSMFLGGPVSENYPGFETELNENDVVLLMSDGFPELFNEKNEMLDYSRLKEIFKNSAPSDAENIVKHLFEAAENWRGNRNQEDDITFAVLKKIV